MNNLTDYYNGTVKKEESILTVLSDNTDNTKEKDEKVTEE